MPDKINIKSPSKLNLFLHIINKRDDGYHNIRSGITFVNLFNNIGIKKNHSTKINYFGTFKPNNGFYENCIIKKTLQFLNLDNKINFEINIEKNIPTQSGLGSSSSDAAGLIKGLEKLNIIKESKKYNEYSMIGADVPVFLYGKNAIVEGIGDEITYYDVPKHFFLLVKPQVNISTRRMFNKININLLNNNRNNDLLINDFEDIAIQEHIEIKNLLSRMSKTKECLAARMTGSGSCCFAIYNNIKNAIEAQDDIKVQFPNLWSFVGENNTMNS